MPWLSHIDSALVSDTVRCAISPKGEIEMARYLVVAHQTAASAELAERLSELAKHDVPVEFVLLVPATRPEHLLTWTEGESMAVARRTAESARTLLDGAGLKIAQTVIGDASPLVAVEDHMRDHPDDYDGIVVSTFPLGTSRWLGLDLPHRLEKRFQLPIIHVVSQPGDREKH